jgi:hypothetical protein
MRPAYAMVKAGMYGSGGKQINSFYPTEKIAHGKKELTIQFGECSMTEMEISGSVIMTENYISKHPECLCDAGSINWNLQMEKQISYNSGYTSSWLAKLCNVTEMHSHFQGMKTVFSGTISVDGAQYAVSPQTSCGYADKFWGREIPSPWMWLSCCNISSIITGKRLTDSCFLVTGCYSRFLRIHLKQKMIIFATVGGKEYEFNFSKFWRRTKITSKCVESGTSLHWTVSAHEHRYILDIDVFCNTEDMVLRSYETANEREELARILSGGNGTGELRIYRKVKKNLELIEHARIRNVGCEYGERETEKTEC